MLKKQLFFAVALCLLGSIAVAQSYRTPYPLYPTDPYQMDFKGYPLPITKADVLAKKVKSVTVYISKTDSTEEQLAQSILFDEKGRIVSYNPNIGDKEQDYIFRLWYENGKISGFTQALFLSAKNWEEIEVTYNYKEGKYASQEQITKTVSPDSTGEKKAHLNVFTNENGTVRKLTISQIINKRLTQGYGATFEYLTNGKDSIVETYILLRGRDKQKVTEHHYTTTDGCKYTYTVYKPYKGAEEEVIVATGEYNDCVTAQKPPSGSVINAKGLIDERPMYDDEGNLSHTLRYEYTYYQ